MLTNSASESKIVVIPDYLCKPGDIVAWSEEPISFHAFLARQAALVAQGFTTHNVGKAEGYTCPSCGAHEAVTLTISTDDEDLSQHFDLCLNCFHTTQLVPIYATDEGGRA